MKILTAFVCFCTALPAANVSGKWGGKFDTTLPNGRVYSAFVFLDLRQEGDRLTGNVGESELKAWPIESGMVQGDKVTFDAHPTDVQIVKFNLSLSANRLLGEAVADRNGTPMKMKVDAAREGAVYWFIHGNTLAEGRPTPGTESYLTALKSYKKAVSLDPKLAVAYVELGRLYLDGNRPADATRVLKKAIALSNDYRAAYTHLAAAYHKLNKPKQAAEVTAKLQEIIKAQRRQTAPVGTPQSQSN